MGGGRAVFAILPSKMYVHVRINERIFLWAQRTAAVFPFLGYSCTRTVLDLATEYSCTGIDSTISDDDQGVRSIGDLVGLSVQYHSS